ncbi:Hypothetical predicted protein, partial [Lynx pardinus]
MAPTWGRQVAQLVKHQTLGFVSDHDLRVDLRSPGRAVPRGAPGSPRVDQPLRVCSHREGSRAAVRRCLHLQNCPRGSATDAPSAG